jgi:ABC-2 type transport system permease protein
VIRIIRAELFKLRRRGMTWILLYIMMGVMVLINLLLLAISQISLPAEALGGLADLSSMLSLSYSLPFTFSILASFGAVMAVILTASSVGNEYNWRTLRIALTSSEGRLKFLWAKLISAIVLVIIGMAACLAVGFLVSMVTNVISGNALDFSFLTGGYLWDQFVQFWRTLFIIMPFTIMGLLFAVVGRSAMPGIAVGVGLLFLEPVITPFMSMADGWVSSIPKYLFSANVNAITALNNLPGTSGPLPFGGGTSTNTSSLPQAFTVLGVYMVVFLITAFYLFKKRDVTG